MEFYREQTRARHRPRVRGTTLSIRYFGGDNVIRPCVSAQCHRQCVRTAQQLAAQLHRVERTRYLIPLVFVTPNLSPRVTNRVYIYIRVVRSRLEIGSVSSSSFGIDRKIGSRDSSCGSHPPLLFASGSRYTFDSCNRGIRGRAIALRLLAPSRATPWKTNSGQIDRWICRSTIDSRVDCPTRFPDHVPFFPLSGSDVVRLKPRNWFPRAYTGGFASHAALPLRYFIRRGRGRESIRAENKSSNIRGDFDFPSLSPCLDNISKRKRKRENRE